MKVSYIKDIARLLYTALINSKRRKDFLDIVNKRCIAVPVDDYLDLLRKERFINNWYILYKRCPKCGELNPLGCICANCNRN